MLPQNLLLANKYEHNNQNFENLSQTLIFDI